MSRKVTVIGAGNVGATIAYTLSLGDIASQIVVVDINREKVEGEVMDIVQGTSFREPISVIAGDYADAADSDIVIITSGIGRKAGQSRIDLAQTNVNIMKDIAPKIAAVAPNALYVIVSNPVDIMTYVFTRVSGIRKARSSAPAPFWTPPGSATTCPTAITSPRRTFMPTSTVSMGIPPSFRGLWRRSLAAPSANTKI